MLDQILEPYLYDAFSEVGQQVSGVHLIPCQRERFEDGTVSLGLSLQVEPQLKLVFQADLCLVNHIAQNMKCGSTQDLNEAVEYLKEFLNMVYGRAVSTYNRAHHQSLRFGIVDWMAREPSSGAGQYRKIGQLCSQAGSACLYWIFAAASEP